MEREAINNHFLNLSLSQAQVEENNVIQLLTYSKMCFSSS